MSEHGEGNPGGQGRMVHALSTVKDLQDGGADVSLWFHSIGVTWLAAFDVRYDAFTRHYGPLLDDLRSSIGGARDFCTNKRFGVGESAGRLGVPTVGGESEHHTIAALALDGWQVLTF
jgi:hypothetical protein